MELWPQLRASFIGPKQVGSEPRDPKMQIGGCILIYNKKAERVMPVHARNLQESGF